MKFFYGYENNYVEITNLVLEKCLVENSKVFIPKTDPARANIFGDPFPGILKHIVVCEDGNNLIYNDSVDINIFTNDNRENCPKICFITAIYGYYEATCKKFATQTIPTDFICFTNIENITRNGWEVDLTPYHYLYKSKLDNDSYTNSLKNNQHTFNIAKYYKQNFQNIPRLKKYDIVIWLDGTIEITNPNTSSYILDLINKNNNLIVFEHERKGKLDQERAASHFHRYTSTYWFNQHQPYQDIDKQYSDYIKDGYNDKDYWKKLFPNKEEYGLWITCFLAFDMKKEETIKFLDEWYLQTLKYTTQDQIGFPYVCQKLKMFPYNLPDENTYCKTINNTSFFIKHEHGL